MYIPPYGKDFCEHGHNTLTLWKLGPDQWKFNRTTWTEQLWSHHAEPLSILLERA